MPDLSAAHVVAIGASAGGVPALRHLVAGLPGHLPAAVVVVLHIPPTAPDMLPKILGRAGPLPSVTAVHGAPAVAGTIHVAPPDRHVLVVDGRLRLSSGPRVNGHRPAIDPLLTSVAEGFGPRAIGVVLSGTRDDGSAGLADIARRGGAALVQDPRDARYPEMPRSALERVPGARSLPAADLGALVAELVTAGVG